MCASEFGLRSHLRSHISRPSQRSQQQTDYYKQASMFRGSGALVGGGRRGAELARGRKRFENILHLNADCRNWPKPLVRAIALLYSHVVDLAKGVRKILRRNRKVTKRVAAKHCWKCARWDCCVILLCPAHIGRRH